jgi:hypothetical protein
MSETNNRPPQDNFTVRGDTKAMPDKGTSTGMNGDTYGASLDQSATNRKGSFDASSDPMDDVMNHKACQ